MLRLSTLLGCTEGQAYTAVIGLVVSLTLASVGLPPTLRPVPVAPTATGPQPGPADPAPVAQEEPTSPTSEPQSTATEVALPEAEAVGPQPDTDDDEPAPGGGLSPGTADGGSAGADEPPALPPQSAFGETSIFAEIGSPGAPHAVTVSEDGMVHVATDNGVRWGELAPSTVTRFDPDGRQDAQLVVSGQAPARRHGILGLVDVGGTLHGLDPSTDRVLTFDLDEGSQAVRASIPDLAPCGPLSDDPCEPGTVDRQPALRGAAADEDGNLFVSDAGQGIIWRLGPDGPPTVWHQSQDYVLHAPGGGLTGLTFDAGGDLVLLTNDSVDDPSTPGGTVRRVPVSGSGDPGDPRLLARTEPGSTPLDVAVAGSGAIHVSLAGADELLVLDDRGEEQHRLTASDVEESAGVPFDEPSGLALTGDHLLVANRSALDEPDHWVVFRVVVG